MSECKQCGKSIESVPGKQPRTFCKGDACRKAYKRANPGQIQAPTPDIATPDTNPGQYQAHPAPYEVGQHVHDHEEPINWADPAKDYSTIARKTQGAVLVPGDPGYQGVCKLVGDAWCVPSWARAPSNPQVIA